MTRQQQYLMRALDHVTAVRARNNTPQSDIYGGLCHTFPVLVRTCGLCQALAFVEAKCAEKNESRAGAYKWLRAHVAAQLDIDQDALLHTVANVGPADYMRHTRAVLQAWVYYKRFAASILHVETPPTAQNVQEMVP